MKLNIHLCVWSDMIYKKQSKEIVSVPSHATYNNRAQKENDVRVFHHLPQSCTNSRLAFIRFLR